MTKPIHTPGPTQLPTGFQFVKPDEHEGMPLFSNGDPFDTIAIVLPRKECNSNARLLAGAYNAFDSAAKALNLNAVELAERMAGGGVAELIQILIKAGDWINDECERRGKEDAAYESPASSMVSEITSAVAKVNGGAA